MNLSAGTPEHITLRKGRAESVNHKCAHIKVQGFAEKVLR